MSTTGKPVPLSRLIDGADTLVGHLIRRSAEIEALTVEVRGLLPESLRPHLLVACTRDHTLNLVTDAPVWAAQLRYRAEDVRISLNAKQGPNLQKVTVSVKAPG